MGSGTTIPFVIKNIVINKGATDDNHLVFSYGVGTTNGIAGGSVAGTINALCSNPKTQIAAGSVSFSGVTWTGNRPVTNDGSGTATGLPT